MMILMETSKCLQCKVHIYILRKPFLGIYSNDAIPVSNTQYEYICISLWPGNSHFCWSQQAKKSSKIKLKGAQRSELRRENMCYWDGKRWKDNAAVKDASNEKEELQYFQLSQMGIHILAVNLVKHSLYVPFTCDFRITKSRHSAITEATPCSANTRSVVCMHSSMWAHATINSADSVSILVP